MKKFIKKIFLFSVFFTISIALTIIVILYYYGLGLKDFPSPMFTNSFSFNQKMEFLRKNTNKADILSSGSSVTLNNLNSEIVTRNFSNNSYLNTASWGLNMQQNFNLIKVLNTVYSPNKIIISSSILDFRGNERDIKSELLKEWLLSVNIPSIYFYIKTFSLSYYINNIINVKKSKNINKYQYLNYDKFGSVHFDSDNFDIESDRWEFGGMDETFDLNQYSYLDSISKFCKQNDIKLYFFQSPIRIGIYSNYDESKIGKLKDHVKKVKSLLSDDHHIFVDVNNVEWADSLFVDSTHMTKQGSEIYTDYCFDKILKND